MKSTLKVVLQYSISLALGIFLLWYALKDQDLNKILATLAKADPIYIIISTVFITISHISRSIRWKILYEPLNYNPSLLNAFLALMSGYFMNHVLPRLGEVTRCGVLQKMEKIPLAISLGTVIAERLADLFMLALLFAFTFFVEYGRLSNFFIDILNSKFKTANSLFNYIYIILFFLAVGTITVIFIYNRFKAKIHNNNFFSKALLLSKKIIEGIISIRKLKQRKAFLFHTVLIWVMYYCASFIMVYALPQTKDLSWLAGFSILLMGSLAMTAPVQGGIGAYEFAVMSVLILYGINKEEGTPFALLTHFSQMLFTIITGGLCFIATFYVGNKKTKL